MTKDYNNFEIQKQILLEYLQVMIAIEDWHGVSDAANDLRVLEAEYRGENKWAPEHTGINPIGLK